MMLWDDCTTAWPAKWTSLPYKLHTISISRVIVLAKWWDGTCSMTVHCSCVLCYIVCSLLYCVLSAILCVVCYIVCYLLCCVLSAILCVIVCVICYIVCYLLYCVLYCVLSAILCAWVGDTLKSRSCKSAGTDSHPAVTSHSITA